MNSIIIDFQGFKTGREFLCKEIAHISLRENDIEPNVTIFQAPFKWHQLSLEDKRVNRFLKYKYNCLSWNDGIIPYRDLKTYLE